MTDDKKQKLDDYIQKVIDLINTINTKTDNFDKLYEFNGKYINYCDNELKQAIILILGIVKDRKTYNFEKEDVQYLITKIKTKYKDTKKHLHEIQSQPNSKKNYKVMSNDVRIYIPSEEEKYIETIVNRQCYIINYLENLIKREDNGKKSYFDDVEHYEKMVKAKQEFVKAKQEYQKHLSIENTKHNTHIYINIDKHSAFEEILNKLRDHKLIDDNNTWIDTKTKFVYFCYVLAQNVFFYGSKYDENKKRYTTPWKDAEKLFHLENTHSSTVIQDIIKGKALNKTAKDDIDNILKPYNLTIPTF